MDPIERLSALFEKFPGIGPRQAHRFVHYLLRSSPTLRREMAGAIQELSGSVHQCQLCMRWYGSEKARDALCSLCNNTERDEAYLAIIASDADLAALERSGTYHGRYFVLGGTISLASDDAKHLRIRQLLESIPKRIESGLTEIILAFPASPEGDATAVRVREELESRTAKPEIRVTTLGRGLSTGSELEYADPETIKSALEGRK